MTESHPHVPESMRSVSPREELYRDPAMSVRPVRSGEGALVTLGDPIARHENAQGDAPDELRAVVNAGGENYALCTTSIDDENVTYIARQGTEEQGAEFVGFLGYSPLSVRKADETGLEPHALFTVSHHGYGVNVENNSRFSDIHVGDAIDREEARKRLFSPRFLLGAAKRAFTKRGDQDQETPLSKTGTWAVHRGQLEQRYREQKKAASWRLSHGAEREQNKEYITTFKAGPEFATQLAEAKAGKRQNPVRYEPNIVTTDKEVVSSDELREVSEGDALIHLEKFFGQAGASLENISYLGEKELNEAAAGIGQYWAKYLKSDPANRIFVYKPEKALDARKSSDYIGEQIVAKLAEGDDKSLLDRVAFLGSDVSALDDAYPEHSKVIVVDDWIGSGMMIRTMARELAERLQKDGSGHFVPSIEANLLMVCDDHVTTRWQFQNDLTGESRELPMVAYFRSSGRSDVMSPFGSHGSNSANFWYFGELGAVIADQTGKSVELPEVAVIKHPYKDK